MSAYRTEVPVEEDIQDLVPGFLQQRIRDLQKIEGCLSQHQFDEIVKTAHTIKGIAQPYGFPTLGALSRELESAAKSANMSSCEACLSNTKKYLSSYVDGLSI